MSIDRSSVLCVVAHPDDLELMAGGTVARWIDEGSTVHALTLSTGAWTAPDGTLARAADDALAEGRRAAALLGYTVENLGRPAAALAFEDALVCEVLRRLDERRCDTLICHWDLDLHHDHEVASRVALAASRRVPRVLMGQVNQYVGRRMFTPNVFVDVSRTWQRKIDALRCYDSQWPRAGDGWLALTDATSRYYGSIAGVDRAEGFITAKLVL
ncbi:MAG: PIG-L family deacetylase [Polyangiaceae bacterium]|nr:PIG-L family deacetylase [Polyangiaceae bacterium]